ncbi:hypothetical protein Tco_1425968, partial [Tanacetum coccineum]
RKRMRLVKHGLEECEFENTSNNDKNLSAIQLEHEREDELVVVVVKVVHELDYRMVVTEIEDGLLEEIEVSHFGKEVMILEWMLVPSCFVIFDLEPLSLSFDFVGSIWKNLLTGFPAQSVRTSNAYALDSLYLLVLNTGTSQSRQHDMSESDSYYLSD